ASASAIWARTRAGSRLAACSRAVLIRTAACRVRTSRLSSGSSLPLPVPVAGAGRRASLWYRRAQSSLQNWRGRPRPGGGGGGGRRRPPREGGGEVAGQGAPVGGAGGGA